MIRSLIHFLLRHRRGVLAVVVVLTALAPLSLLRLQVDTDPENMLPADDPARVRTAALAETFDSPRQLVVGIDTHDRITAPQLAAVGDLQSEVADLPGVDRVGVLGPGARPSPATQDEADRVLATIADHPVLAGQVAADDGTLVTLGVPLTEDADVRDLGSSVEDLVSADPRLAGVDVVLGGVPHAQEAFGVQMFLQMALFAPLAALVVMAAVWWLLRRFRPVVATMSVSLVTALWTMGLLVGTGHTVHIMSSMIPIFLLPIAILDSIHVLSEYDERLGDATRTEKIVHVYEELSRPLALTTLTTMIGFGSLALTPIPPVRTFGVFVAVGVGLAWALTMLLLPVLLAAIEPRARTEQRAHTWTARLVRRTGAVAVARRGWVLTVAVAVTCLALAGVARIEVNDNPVEWFRADHPVRADADLLDERLAGTASLNLVIEGDPGEMSEPGTVRAVHELSAQLEAMPQVGSVADFTRLSPDDPLSPLLVTADASKANLWLRLHDGDNRTVQEVVDRADALAATVDLPSGLDTAWAGQAYVNLTWQQQMVSGMTTSFLVALVLLALVLTMVFRSVRWGLLAMVPVLGTVVIVYGFLGWAGADFDMPTAVLSTLSLGIGVDFAIHFVSRFRTLLSRIGDPRGAVVAFMEEPGRALTRNALVVAIGFLPLLLADLVPYVLVGVLLATIMALSWLTTMTVLPSIAVSAPVPQVTRSAAASVFSVRRRSTCTSVPTTKVMNGESTRNHPSAGTPHA